MPFKPHLAELPIKEDRHISPLDREIHLVLQHRAQEKLSSQLFDNGDEEKEEDQQFDSGEVGDDDEGGNQNSNDILEIRMTMRDGRVPGRVPARVPAPSREPSTTPSATQVPSLVPPLMSSSSQRPAAAAGGQTSPSQSNPSTTSTVQSDNNPPTPRDNLDLSGAFLSQYHSVPDGYLHQHSAQPSPHPTPRPAPGLAHPTPSGTTKERIGSGGFFQLLRGAITGQSSSRANAQSAPQNLAQTGPRNIAQSGPRNSTQSGSQADHPQAALAPQVLIVKSPTQPTACGPSVGTTTGCPNIGIEAAAGNNSSRDSLDGIRPVPPKPLVPDNRDGEILASLTAANIGHAVQTGPGSPAGTSPKSNENGHVRFADQISSSQRRSRFRRGRKVLDFMLYQNKSKQGPRDAGDDQDVPGPNNRPGAGNEEGVSGGDNNPGAVE